MHDNSQGTVNEMLLQKKKLEIVSQIGFQLRHFLGC